MSGRHVALVCDLEGRVREVLRVAAEVSLRPGAALTEVVDPASGPKVAALLDELRAGDRAAIREVIMPVGGRMLPFTLVGARYGDALLVLASGGDQAVVDLVEELASLNREQSVALREAFKATSGLSADHRELFIEMSRLNNELATTQRELTRQNFRLQELLREKNEVVGMVAHDLRNPLAVIAGIAEHLLREAKGRYSEREVDMLGHVQESSAHLLHLVEDLLDLASFEVGTVRVDALATDVIALVERCVRLARELAADKGITIELEEIGAASPALRCAALDPHKITQALTNLLTNAIKFSHPGAAVQVRVEGLSDAAVITVADRGIGIAPERLAGLFTPFQPGVAGTRGERTRGLGLAIVRRLVHAHGGEVQVESALGVGTTFTIRLPLRRFAGPGAAAAAAARRRSGPLKVLLADDDPITVALLTHYLEARGHVVVGVEDAGAAVAALGHERFDLVIVDLEMPGGGGARVAAALPSGARPAIVALTGHTAARAAALAKAAGIEGVHQKPLSEAALDAILAGIERG